MRIPVNEPLLDGNEKRYLAECIDTGWISSEGPFVRRLEEEFAARAGRKHGVAVCNGSAALDTAVAALRIGPGDEVILPTFTIISCAAAVVRAGATPVLVDCDPHTWNMRADQVAEHITPRTKAIMAVHIYGLPVDMDPLLSLAKKHGLFIIEDAAELHGADYRGRPCGSFGDISTFSFYPNKHVTDRRRRNPRYRRRGPRRALPVAAQPLLPAGKALRSRGTRLEFPDNEPAGGARRGAARTPRRICWPQAPDGAALHGASARRFRPAAAA